jgi:antitoxin component YwqK of YwqJK toxin-antitoxin module
MKKILIILVMACSGITLGQKKIDFIDVDLILKKANSNAQKQDYKAVLKELNRIPVNDSIYCGILIRKSYYLLQDKQYDKLETVYNEAVELDCSEQLLEIRSNQAVAYFRTEQYDKAITTCDQILEARPYNANAMYNKALALSKKGNYEESAQLYQKLVRINPLDKDVHLQLGVLCYNRGLTAQALLALNMFMLLSDNLEDNIEQLKSLNKLSYNLSTVEVEDYKLSNEDDDFKTINQILDQRLALQDSYDTGSKIDLQLVRQNHALFSYLKDHKGNKGLWSEVYVPVFQKVMNEEFFEEYTYYITQALKNGDLSSLYRRNQDKAAEVGISIAQYYMGLVGEVAENKSYYYEEGKLAAIGNKIDDQPIGLYSFYNSKGSNTSEGEFHENHELTGTWNYYYENGSVRESQEFESGKKDGVNLGYHPNGMKSYELFWKNDLAIGKYTYYTTSGALKIDKELLDSKNNGAFKEYFDIGKSALEYEGTYKNDFINGSLKEYYSDGTLFKDANYDLKMLNGLEKTYNIKGTLVAEVNYKDGELNGIYKTYHNNGKISIDATSKSGYFFGKYTYYFDNGEIATKCSYNEDGEIDGLYQEFASDGKLWLEYNYRNGKISNYTYYNKKGAVVHTDKKRSGSLKYIGYNTKGDLKMEGAYDVKDGKTGMWKYYNDKNGSLSSSGSFEEDQRQGVHKKYYPEGIEQEITTYKDDAPQGYSVFFYPNGKIKSQLYFKNGVEHGSWETYHEDGSLKTKSYYNNGEIINDSETYDVEGKLTQVNRYKKGEVISETNYHPNGKVKEKFEFPRKSGVSTQKYTNNQGNLIMEYSYLNGVLHGSVFQYGSGGIITFKGQYFHGNRQGVWEWFDTEGNKESIREYYLNSSHGKVEFYYPNGSLSAEYTDLFDQLEGTYKSYWKNGSISTLSFYKSGKLHGERKNYDPSGNLQLIRYYDDGAFIGYAYEKNDGTLIDTIPIKKETAKVTAYYKNGQISRDYTLKAGQIMNTYKIFYPSGQLLSSTAYKYGLMDGKEIDYYESGNLKSKTNYLMDEKHGLETLYHSNGKMKKETTFKSGKKNGPCKNYDEQGQLKKTEEYYNNELQF